MSVSNCSAYAATAYAQPITGIVRPQPGPSEVPVVQPISAIKPVGKKDDQVESALNMTSLDPSTLSAILGFAG